MHVDDDDTLAAEPGRLADILDSVYRPAEIADPNGRAVTIGDDHRIESRGIEFINSVVAIGRMTNGAETFMAPRSIP